MEMETRYDPGAVEARWLDRREPGSALPVGDDPAAVVSDILDRRAAMGGGDPVAPSGTVAGAIPGDGPDGGVDAVRFGVALMTGEERFDRGRRFLRKLWHGSRFALGRLEEAGPGGAGSHRLEDRWILSRLNAAVGAVGGSLDAGRLALAAERADEFVRRDLSAGYLPLVRTRTDPAARETLADLLGTVLPLLHPFVPVVTEEIRTHLSRVLGEAPVVLGAGPWPTQDEGRHDGAAEREMGEVREIARKVRNLRAAHGVREGPEAVVVAPDEDAATRIGRHLPRLVALTGLPGLRVATAPPAAESVAGVVGGAEVHLTVEGDVDPQSELARLTKEYEDLSAQVRVCERRLANRDFLERAPEDVVDRERDRRDGLADRILRIRQHIEGLE
jgi:valyl-tRNA synthetase